MFEVVVEVARRLHVDGEEDADISERLAILPNTVSVKACAAACRSTPPPAIKILASADGSSDWHRPSRAAAAGLLAGHGPGAFDPPQQGDARRFRVW